MSLKLKLTLSHIYMYLYVRALFKVALSLYFLLDITTNYVGMVLQVKIFPFPATLMELHLAPYHVVGPSTKFSFPFLDILSRAERNSLIHLF